MQQNWKFRRGDIYYVQFGNTSTGSEQHGDRPAVIIQNDVGNTYAPTLIVVPLTSNTEKKVTQPTHCLLENEGLSMSSMALAEQIFTIDKSRILKYLGHADLYDSANFEAKKMIVNQLIRRVDVYRGYQINISFNFDLTPYIEGE